MISSDVLYSMIKLGLTYIAGMQAGARLYSDLSAVQDRIEVDLKSSVEKRGGHPLTTTPSLKEARPPLRAVTVMYDTYQPRANVLTRP